MQSVSSEAIRNRGVGFRYLRQLARRQRQRHPLLWFTARRVAAGLLTLFVATVLIYAAVDVLPGNVASNVLGRNGSPAQLRALEHKLGLDRPLIVRYGDWLGGILHGSFGNSTTAIAQGSTHAPISKIISGPAVNSLILAGFTALLFIPLALLLGVLAGVRPGSARDHVISTTSLTIVGMPEFVTGTLLILVFFSELRLLPPVSLVEPGQTALADPNILVLPVATLLATTTAGATRMLRAGMAAEMRRNYVAMARLNGFSERRVVLRHALRNAMAPSVQIVAQMLQYLLGGIIIVESVFSYPGLGTTLVNAIDSRDATLVEAVALVLAAAYITINVIADLIVVFLVPKLRTTA